MSGKVRVRATRAKKWDALASEGLEDSKEAAYYLEEAFADGPEMFLLALNRVVRSRGGIGKLAKRSGLSRESLYKLLSGERGARLSTVAAILAAMDIRVGFTFEKPKPKGRLVGSEAA